MQDVVDHMDIGSCNKGIKYLSASSRLLRYIFLIDNVCDVYFGIQPCELYIYIYICSLFLGEVTLCKILTTPNKIAIGSNKSTVHARVRLCNVKITTACNDNVP